MWKEIAGYPKRKYLITLWSNLDYTTQRLSVQEPIVATTGLLNPTLALGFRLEHCENLGLGVHQFFIFQHIFSAWKVLNNQAYQHQVIAGGIAASALDDVVMLMAPDGVFLPVTLVMARGYHTLLRVVLATLFGPYHPNKPAMKEV